VCGRSNYNPAFPGSFTRRDELTIGSQIAFDLNPGSQAHHCDLTPDA
jgi:hypothetical protein